MDVVEEGVRLRQCGKMYCVNVFDTNIRGETNILCMRLAYCKCKCCSVNTDCVLF